jgi:hypothetical protein
VAEDDRKNEKRFWLIVGGLIVVGVIAMFWVPYLVEIASAIKWLMTSPAEGD